MRKGVLVVLLIAIVLALAGCKSGDKSGSVSSSATPFIGGAEGVRISFLENAPPKETLDNPKPGTLTELSKFDIVLRVENVGEQDVPANTLKATVGGIFPSDFNVGTGKTTPSLEKALAVKLDGVKKDPEGGKITGGLDEVSYLDLGYVKSLEGNNDFPIQADVCYPYRTRAVADFCMRRDLTKVTAGVCDIKGSKSVFSSGGPVQVVSFEEAVGGQKKVILKFKIKTTGTGTIYKPDTTWTAGSNPTTQATCKRGDFQTEDFVRVTVNSGVAGLSCSGWGGALTKDVRLTNGEASVTCIQSGVEVDAVQKVNIQLEYNHLITASTRILVKHLPTDIVGGTTGGSAAPAGGSSGTGAPPPPPPPGGSSSLGGPAAGNRQSAAVSTSDPGYGGFAVKCAATPSSGTVTPYQTGYAYCVCMEKRTWDPAKGCIGPGGFQDFSGGSPRTSATISKGNLDPGFVNIRQKCAATGGTMYDTDAAATQEVCLCPEGKTFDKASSSTTTLGCI